MNKINKITNKLLEIIYPTYIYCFACGSIIDNSREYGLCDNCIEKFSWATGRTCKKCGKVLGEKDRGNLCHDCMRREHEFDKAFTCTRYGLYERRLISKFKNEQKSYFAEALGRILYDRIVIENLNVSGIIPIPMHKEKLKKRGYNQALLMATELSKRMGVEVYPDVVKRVAKTLPNKKLDAFGRMANMKNAFAIEQGRVQKIKGKDILLIDDIYTTGATVDVCSRLLKENGAGKVYVLTFSAGTSKA